MPLAGYGLLKGKAIESQNGGGENHHFHVLVDDDELRHRIAVNVTSSVPPSDLLYFVDKDFDHPIIEELIALSFGFIELESEPGGMALDYIRADIFDPTKIEAPSQRPSRPK